MMHGVEEVSFFVVFSEYAIQKSSYQIHCFY